MAPSHVIVAASRDPKHPSVDATRLGVRIAPCVMVIGYMKAFKTRRKAKILNLHLEPGAFEMCTAHMAPFGTFVES